MNQKISIARSRLLLDHPFFGVLALRLGAVPDPSIPTLATDGRTMFYNPTYIEELDIQFVSSAIAHEAMHCVLDHMDRRGARDPGRWNAACDYAANPLLRQAGLPLHPDWLYDVAYLNKTADEIYNLLPKQTPQAQDSIMPSPNAADREDVALEWRIATVQAAKTAQQCGRLPAGFERLVRDALAPPIPWRERLARFMSERARDDYSWRRPNPYYIHSGIYLPSMDGVRMGEVVIAVDTSGSVLDAVDEFGATMRDIINCAKPQRTHVIYCDARVNRVDVFSAGQQLQLHAVGGGGTDFRPVFEYVQEQGLAPACLLYLTDMYGSFPESSPSYPTLWCATSDVEAPWGELIRIKD